MHLSPSDRLPLTCTREGVCCHGKQVWVNPWEVAGLAAARQTATRDFRDRFTTDAGIRLAFTGAPGWRAQAACSQYAPGRGCVAHAGRPLACRLYPLGRERQGERVRYLHEGDRFPCLDGCPSVVELPHLSVDDYLAGQQVAAGEAAQDAYLDVVQDLGEGAFVLVFDSGLAARDRTWQAAWRQAVQASPRERAARLGPVWLDRLTVPDLPIAHDAPVAWITAHRELLQANAQSSFASLGDIPALINASATMLTLALHLAQSLGADHRRLGRQWVERSTASSP